MSWRFFFFFPRLHNGDGGETNGGVSQVGGRRNCCWEMTDLQKKGGIPTRFVRRGKVGISGWSNQSGCFDGSRFRICKFKFISQNCSVFISFPISEREERRRSGSGRLRGFVHVFSPLYVNLISIHGCASGSRLQAGCLGAGLLLEVFNGLFFTLL